MSGEILIEDTSGFKSSPLGELGLSLRAEATPSLLDTTVGRVAMGGLRPEEWFQQEFEAHCVDTGD